MTGTGRRSCPTLGARIALLSPLAMLAGCDPILSIDGAFFPAWLLCMIGAAFLLGAIRWALHRWKIEPHVGPRTLVYVCTYLTCTLGLWLLIFRK
jgi:hypothetical protein